MATTTTLTMKIRRRTYIFLKVSLIHFDAVLVESATCLYHFHYFFRTIHVFVVSLRFLRRSMHTFCFAFNLVTILMFGLNGQSQSMTGNVEQRPKMKVQIIISINIFDDDAMLPGRAQLESIWRVLSAFGATSTLP